MDKRTISGLKSVVRAVKKDATRIALAFDGLKAFASLTTGTNGQGLMLAQREILSAIDSMRLNLDTIAQAIGQPVGDGESQGWVESTSVTHGITHSQTVSTGQGEESPTGKD